MSDDDHIADEDLGPAERLVRSLARPREEQVLAPPRGQQAAPPRQPFTGLLGFTFRLWWADLWVLLAIAALATGASLLAGLLLEGIHARHAFSGDTLVMTSWFPPHVGLSAPMVATGLIAIAAQGWANATTVALLLGQVCGRRRIGLSDLGCGLPFWGWTAAILLLEIVLDRASELVPPPLNLVISVLFLTGFVFYVQVIVDRRRNGLAALGASWRLVFRQAGFWRVLGWQLRLMLIAGPAVLLAMALPTLLGGHTGVEDVGVQLGSGLFFEPLSAVFVTLMYLLTCGEREQVETMLAAGGPAVAAEAQ
jgi:hypothetical protein